MNPQLMYVMIAVAIAIIIVAALVVVRNKRSERLQSRFGPEYERTVNTVGNPAKAEAILSERAARVNRFRLRPLTRDQAQAFAQQWRAVQTRFVDDPEGAVGAADDLVTQVMTARGYPLEDFERRAEDVSVDHPHVVENYRVARMLVQRRARDEATTEELRQAVVNYRALFDDLLKVDGRHTRRAS